MSLSVLHLRSLVRCVICF